MQNFTISKKNLNVCEQEIAQKLCRKSPCEQQSVRRICKAEKIFFLPRD